MKKTALYFVIVFLLGCLSCDRQEDGITPSEDTGFLKLGVALSIEEIPAGRVAEEVPLENYKVTIFRSDDTEEIVFDPWSTAPDEIELPTGEYYVVAHSNNLVNAAFDNPYYYGESELFTIDKEEIKEISVTCTLANYKISFVYSDNLKTDFDEYGAVVSMVNFEDQLDFGDSEELEGYFIPNEPVEIEVLLKYFKVFEDETIERTLIASIPDPQPRTHYRVNADAELADGKILIKINVDDGVEVIDIETSEVPVLNGPADPETLGADFESAGEDMAFGTRIWRFSNIDLADYNRIFWGPVIGAMKASMDGDNYEDDGTINEILDFVPGESNLANGVLVWMGTTQIPLADGTFSLVNTRMEMEVLELDGITPFPLIDPGSVGMPSSLGGLAEFADGADGIEVHFRLLSSYTMDNWDYYLKLFDEAPTPPDAGGTAISQFTGGFYWD